MIAKTRVRSIQWPTGSPAAFSPISRFIIMGPRRANRCEVPGAPGILLTKIYKLLTKREVPYPAARSLGKHCCTD